MFRRVYCNVSMLAAFSGVFSALVFTTFRHSFPSFNKVLQRNQRSYDMDEIRSDFLATMAEQVAVSLNELGYVPLSLDLRFGVSFCLVLFQLSKTYQCLAFGRIGH